MVRVRPAWPVASRTYDLSTLDQVAKRMYGSTMLAFALKEDADIERVFDGVCDGLANVLAENPLLAGRLVRKPGTNGLMHVIVSAHASVEFTKVDLRHGDARWTHGTFQQIRAQGCPSAVTQREPLILPPNITDLDEFPCFVGQITFIHGGCFLWFGVPHLVIDGGSRTILAPRWAALTAAASKGIRLGPQPLPSSAYDRRIMSDGEEPTEIDVPQSAAPTAADPAPTPGSEVELTIWLLPAAKYKTLKETASTPGERISSGDALGALFWSSISRARRLHERGYRESSFISAVDVRKKMSPKLPDPYWGNAATICPVSLPLNQVLDPADDGLRYLARSIRATLNAFDVTASARKLIGAVSARFSGKSPGPGLNLNVNMGPDILCSSHQSEPLFNLDWGDSLGLPVFFRAPEFGQVGASDGTININPRMLDGSVEVMTALDKEVTHRLRRDPQLRRYAEPLDGHISMPTEELPGVISARL